MVDVALNSYQLTLFTADALRRWEHGLPSQARPLLWHATWTTMGKNKSFLFFARVACELKEISNNNKIKIKEDQVSSIDSQLSDNLVRFR